MDVVLFACVENAGRSQMAAALFNQAADPARARAVSAGTRPAAMVHPEVAHVMREIGLDLVRVRPRALSRDLAAAASLLVTMGCGEDCPLVPGLRVEEWSVPDPKGQPAEHVRQIREEIRGLVAELVTREGWAREGPDIVE